MTARNSISPADKVELFNVAKFTISTCFSSFKSKSALEKHRLKQKATINAIFIVNIRHALCWDEKLLRRDKGSILVKPHSEIFLQVFIRDDPQGSLLI